MNSFNPDFIFCLCLFVLLAACDASQKNNLVNFNNQNSAGKYSQNILGGKEVSFQQKDLRAIVSIEAKFQVSSVTGALTTETAECTGVLITDRIVLTAGHCVEFDEAVDVAQFTVHIFSDKINNQEQMKSYKVLRARPHEDYAFGDRSATNDLALLLLADSVDKTVQPISLTKTTEKITSQNELTIVGFGKQKDMLVSEELQKKQMMFSRVRIATQIAKQQMMLPKDKNPRMYVDQTKGSGVCQGDSGGPLLISRPSGYEVVGVASYVFNPKDERRACSGYAAFSNVGFYRNWIQETVKELINQ